MPYFESATASTPRCRDSCQEARKSMALACRVEEPSTASDSDTIASVADQFETDITTPGNGSVKYKSFRVSSLRGSRETEVLRRIGRAGPPPTRQDLIDVQTAASGQTEKNSVRAYVFRFALELGHCLMQSTCVKRAQSTYWPCGSRYPKHGAQLHAFRCLSCRRA